MLFSTDPPAAVPAWQQRALDRSLQDARTRSVERMAGFVDSARQLATESGDASFTVQQVVQRAGGSLKSFYRHFSGKDALLLALIEEESRTGAALLAGQVQGHRDPVDRLRAYLGGLLGFLAQGEPSYVAMLTREQRRLEHVDPAAMAGALAPFTDLLADLLAEAGAAGRVRPGDRSLDASVLFTLVLHQINRLGPGPTRAATEEAAAYLWDLCWHGLGAAPSPDTPSSSDTPPFSATPPSPNRNPDPTESA